MKPGALERSPGTPERSRCALSLALPGLVLILFAGLFVATSCEDARWSHLKQASVLDHEFTAVREYTFVLEDGTLDTYQVVFESAGDRERFDFELHKLNGKTHVELMTDPVQKAKFESLRGHLAAGGAYRMLYQVGFRIDDFELLRQNYLLVSAEARDHDSTSGMGLAVEFVLAARHADRPHWRILLSAEPGREGLLLGYEEFRYATGGSRSPRLPDGDAEARLWELQSQLRGGSRHRRPSRAS